MQNFTKQDLKTLYLASQCLFFVITFNTDNYDLMVGHDKKYSDNVALLQYFYKIICEREEDYNDLISYFDEYVDDACDILVLGVHSIDIVTKGQYAFNLLLDIEALRRELTQPNVPYRLGEKY